MGSRISSPIKKLGDWVTKTNNTEYTATTDGLVCAFNTDTGIVAGFTPTATQRCYNFFGPEAYGAGITMPVRKGDTWKVTGAATVYWIPLA